MECLKQTAIRSDLHVGELIRSDLHVGEFRARNQKHPVLAQRDPGSSHPRQDPLDPLVAPLTGGVAQYGLHTSRDLELTTSGAGPQR